MEQDSAAAGIVIRIRREGRPAADRMDCIHRAAHPSLLLFDDPAWQASYDRHAAEQARADLLASARTQLAKMGLLTGFPRRADHADTADYLRALERHAGFAEGSALRMVGDGVVIDGGDTAATTAGLERLVRLSAVAAYAAGLGDIDGVSVVGSAQAAGPAG